MKPETTTPKETDPHTPPADAAPPNEDKHSFNWGWIAWPFVILFLYVLSYGPVVAITGGQLFPPSSRLYKIERTFYNPWRWAYNSSPLHKPLGIYMHLWVPKIFDKNGEPCLSPD